MSDKIALITGATNGIGEVAARELAKQGMTVVVVGRSAARATATVQRIKAAGVAPVEPLLADLSSQADLRRLAEAFRSRFGRLDVLLNNAGAFFDRREESVDGIELTWALNHLAYFTLTDLLLDTLKDTAAQHAEARVVNVSSTAHRGGRINWEDPEGKRSYNGWMAYCQSKLANLLFTVELARRLEGSGVTANALHPGFVNTGFSKNNGTIFARLFQFAQQLVALTPEQGAQTLIYAAASPQLRGITGQYLDNSKIALPAPHARSLTDAARLWELTERRVAQLAAA
jgi:NAD(P)-dependent dehydrogenase (short-subunit alcohol dehydrogenase family)